MAINNYYLVFSYSGNNKQQCIQALNRGYNVAVVFKDQLPTRHWNRPVISGDIHDLRFKDSRTKIIGLVAKGRARKAQDSFVI